MRKKKQHPSSSTEQKEIEKNVVDLLEIEYECKFSEQPVVPSFKFDFYNQEKRIIGEVYAGIDNIKSGSRRKILADFFKLIAAEKIFIGKWKKIMVFVDANIKKSFENDSWAKEAIEVFEIELKTVEITEEQKKKLRSAKKRQQEGNKFTTKK